MKNLKIGLYSLLLLGIFFTSGCGNDDDDDNPPNEEEVITSLVYALVPSTGGIPVILTFTDLDGDGGNAPIITVSNNLAANTTYNGSLTLRNDSAVPAEDITLEIAEEDDEHQFFFQPSSGLNTTVAYADQDRNGRPLGLLSTLTTGAASSGSLRITLRHEPDKEAAGVAEGNVANAGGETDIEVAFSLTVQ